MREIKFRGRKPNGEWIYGDLVRSEDNILGDVTTCIFPQKAYDSYDRYIVDANTIGQFTGLHDKNGKEIYDGDIIKIYDSVAGCVRYNAKYWRYEVAAPKEPIDNERIPSGTPSECWEIIGNIHDNPELLNN